MSATGTIATAAAALAGIAQAFVEFEHERTALEPIATKENGLLALIEAHKRALAKLSARRAKVQRRVDRANPWSRARYLQPLAEALLPYFPGARFQISGPFGLGSTSSIAFVSDAPDADEGEPQGFLQFRLEGEGNVLGYLDPCSDNGRYPAGSIGRLNGLHHQVHPIRADMPLADLAQLFRRYGAQA